MRPRLMRLEDKINNKVIKKQTLVTIKRQHLYLLQTFNNKVKWTQIYQDSSLNSVR